MAMITMMIGMPIPNPMVVAVLIIGAGVVPDKRKTKHLSIIIMVMS